MRARAIALGWMLALGACGGARTTAAEPAPVAASEASAAEPSGEELAQDAMRPAAPAAWDLALPVALEAFSLAVVPRDGSVVVAGRIGGTPPSGWLGRVGPDGALLWSREFVSSSHAEITDVAIDAEGRVRAIGWAQQRVTVADPEGAELASIDPTGGGRSGALRVVLTAAGELVSATLATSPPPTPATAPRGRGRRAPPRVFVIDEVIVVTSPFAAAAIASVSDELLVIGDGDVVSRWSADGSVSTIATIPSSSRLAGEGRAWLARSSILDGDAWTVPATISFGVIEGDAARDVGTVVIAAPPASLAAALSERAPSLLLDAGSEGAAIATTFAGAVTRGGDVLAPRGADALVIRAATDAPAVLARYGGEGVDVAAAIDRGPDGTIALLLDCEGSTEIAGHSLPAARSHVLLRVDPSGEVSRVEVLPGTAAAPAAIAIADGSVLVARSTWTGESPARELRRVPW